MAPGFDANRYKKLAPEDFDAIVTGELAHYAIWLEDGLVTIISEFFAVPSRKKDFIRLLLHREALTFQDKIEIVGTMVPLYANPVAAMELKVVLKKIEAFKSQRNAFAHGRDVTPESSKGASIHVELVGRTGKGKVIEVTPESHVKTLGEMDQLLEILTSISKRLNQEADIAAASPTLPTFPKPVST